MALVVKDHLSSATLIHDILSKLYNVKCNREEKVFFSKSKRKNTHYAQVSHYREVHLNI